MSVCVCVMSNLRNKRVVAPKPETPRDESEKKARIEPKTEEKPSVPRVIGYVGRAQLVVSRGDGKWIVKTLAGTRFETEAGGQAFAYYCAAELMTSEIFPEEMKTLKERGASPWNLPSKGAKEIEQLWKRVCAVKTLTHAQIVLTVVILNDDKTTDERLVKDEFSTGARIAAPFVVRTDVDTFCEALVASALNAAS